MVAPTPQSRHSRVSPASGVAHSGWGLSLLGPWRLTGHDHSVRVGVKAQRLLALLALRGACPRSYVAGLLWQDCSDPHAMGNLRATLSRLHGRGLRDVVHSDDGVLSLDSDVEVDVRVLVGTASAVLDEGGEAADREALRILRSDELLVGWYDDWVVLHRERIRQLRLHALEVLSARLAADGHGAAAVEAALAAVVAEPLRESAHRALICAHLSEGNRGEAVRQLSRLRALLRYELGVEPSAKATGLLR